MRTVIAAALLIGMGSSAVANQCPMLWKQIDAKLQTAQPSTADIEKVAELRKTGEELHKSGDHAGSEAALNQALTLLD